VSASQSGYKRIKRMTIDNVSSSSRGRFKEKRERKEKQERVALIIRIQEKGRGLFLESLDGGEHKGNGNLLLHTKPRTLEGKYPKQQKVLSFNERSWSAKWGEKKRGR